MLAIAGQTAVPNGLQFVKGTQGTLEYPGGNMGQKIKIFPSLKNIIF